MKNEKNKFLTNCKKLKNRKKNKKEREEEGKGKCCMSCRS